MRKVILFIFTTISLAVFGYWFYLVQLRLAGQYQDIYTSFGMAVPKFTKLFLASLPYWKIIIGIVGLLSYMPIFLFKGRLQLLSVSIPIACALYVFIALYFPVLMHGPVI